MSTKQFDKVLYNDNDSKAKEIIKNVLLMSGFKESEILIKEDYKSDIQLKDNKNNRIIRIEVELRDSMHYNNILNGKYKTINVPYRKIKNKNNSFWYCGVSSDGTGFYRFKTYTIHSCPVQKLDNKYMKNEDMVIVTPDRDGVEFYKIEKGSITRIR